MDTTTNLLTQLQDYATSRGFKFELEELSAPPGLLQGLIRTPGICLTVYEPEPTDESPAQLGVWLSTAGSEVTCCMMREGDDEIETTSHTLPEDEERMAFVNQMCRHFYLHFVFIPAIEAWSDEVEIGYQIIKPTEFYGNAAALVDCTKWFFIKIKTPKPGCYDLTVGVCANGHAATFEPGEDGFLDFDEWETGLKSGSELKAWLQSLLTTN